MATKTYYCGELGKVSVYDHTTTTWYSVDVPGAKSLYDIMCFPNNSDKVITVGDVSGLSDCIWVGSNVANVVTWNTPTITLFSGSIAQLNEVWITDDNYVYAIGRKNAQGGPVLIKSIDGGLTFTEVGVPGGFSGSALHFPTPSLGVVAIDKSVYYTTNGGVTFIPTNGGNPLDFIINPIAQIANIKGVQIYEQSSNFYRITVLTSNGVVQSVDGLGTTYLARFDYEPISTLGRIAEHLTWYGNNTFWATDLTGGLVCSEDGGVNWVIALPVNNNYNNNIRGAHFYEIADTGTSPLGQPYIEYTGFLATNFVSANLSTTTQNQSKVALLYPNNISSLPVAESAASQTFYAVWTEVPLTTCVRLKECNGTKEIIIKDIQDQATGQYLSQKGVGASIVLTWTGGNSNSPCLLATDNFPEICWTIEEIIEDCDIEDFCEEVLPIT